MVKMHEVYEVAEELPVAPTRPEPAPEPLLLELGDLVPRRLQGKDLFTVLRIIHSQKGEVRRLISQFAAAQSGDAGSPRIGDIFNIDMGLTLAFALMELADGPIREWLADLADAEPDAFDKADLVDDIIPFVIALRHQEDWSTFLARVSDLLGNKRAIKIASSTATAGRTRRSNGSR